MKKTAVFIIGAMLSCYSMANSLEMSIFSKIAGLKFNADLGNAYEGSLGYLHSQYDNKDSNLTTASFFARGIRGQMTGKIGGQAFWLNGNRHDTYGLAIGGGLKYLITPEFWTSGEAFYAPDIIVGGDYQNYYNMDLKVGYNILPQASVFLAYQIIGANDGKRNQEMYNGIKVGLDFRI